MVFDLSKVTGIGEFTKRAEAVSDDSSRILYSKVSPDATRPPVFLVDNGNTIEIRSDEKLITLLTEKYESVMKSRYFGAGGLEIVLAGHQLTEDELADLVRLSYNLTN